MQKCLSNKQETKEKVLKENKELKKEMIHNYSTKNMKSPKKLRKIIILKKKLKKMNKEQIQEKEKAVPERESNQSIIKDLEKPKRELEKQNATLRTINLEVETKLHSSNIYLNNKNSNNGHQTVKTKEIQNIIEKL